MNCKPYVTEVSQKFPQRVRASAGKRIITAAAELLSNAFYQMPSSYLVN